MSIPARHLISAPKGMVTHVGLSLGNGLVFHNNPDNGEHISDLASFHKGKPVSVGEQLSHFDFHQALANISTALKSPKAYHLTDNNCEQSLNRVLGRPASSPQLQFWTVATLLLAGLAYMANRK